MKWQKRARVGVALFGVASAIVVYAAIGERAKPAAPVATHRIDPKAVIESQGNILQQVRGTKQDYLVEAEQQLVYEGGATKLVGVKVTVRNRSGRDFFISAREAMATNKQQELHLGGDVKLAASDGFEIETSEAFFTQGDGNVRAPNAFAFRRGLMSGTGTGMTYDRDADILSIAENADVKLTDEGDNTLTHFSAGAAVFTRPEHRLDLSGTVHVLHNNQVIDSTIATALLSDDDSLVRSINLDGRSQVGGGGNGLDAMNADHISLNYAGDGVTINHANLIGSGHVRMTRQDGSPGREIFGRMLDITLAPDGALTKLLGRGGVRLDLAATAGAPARRVTAQSLDGAGASGKGLTTAQFRDRVEFREDTTAGKPPRLVTSRALQIGMADDAVRSAVFTGNVAFNDQELQAAGGEAIYAPAQGTLRLLGGTDKIQPRVADDQVAIEGTTVDLTLDGRKITAGGGVKTTLKARPAGARAGGAGGATATKLPGLLKQEQAANVSATTLVYDGGAGKAAYEGGAALVQGDTAIRADRITIDQAKGDLLATGTARSTFTLDSGTSIGQANTIEYADAARTVTYEGIASRPGTAGVQARLSGTQGDLRADRIQIALAATGNKAERLEAYTGVNLSLDQRKASGARLTYYAVDDRYVMTGTGTAPVKVVDNCRATTGKTLIFFKSADRMIVDGNEEIRTLTTNGGACAASPVRPR